ncbi:putative hemolysin [Cereibacter ovatus]|uniref:Putative hemolysin n=1 Tax=Cereibacter ovatus TaxID=439529 RepID=A0A285D5B2_9RHOB|nr:hemolysin family protein [Cereibacter ovatus]SNX74546.1 putative hemolysin [Cereibacter ovatus]
MYIEIAIVLLLTLINGLLAMSELAIVSARPARLKLLADQHVPGAATAIRLAAEPGRFLSSVQIGITLVGVLSGAFSGATLGSRLAASLAGAGLPVALAQSLGVGVVVVAITYLSLIVGELVPKQIALRAPERVACRVAPIMRAIATVAAPLVWLLDRSGRGVLRLLGQGGATTRTVTDDEVRLLVSEAEASGAMHASESRMISGVMRMADRTARGLMTPRHEVEVLDADSTRPEAMRLLGASRRSRLPVRDGGPDDIIGVVAARDIANAPADEGFDLRALVQDAPVVHENQGAIEVIERLRATPSHMVLVYDEYGTFEGIVTPLDLLEIITGAFGGEVTEEPVVVTRSDGSMLVAGWMPVDEFAELLSLRLPEPRDHATAAGLVLETLGRIPVVGDSFRLSGWKIEVLDLDGRRIDKLLVSRMPAALLHRQGDR